jgi:hypothetical protein
LCSIFGVNDLLSTKHGGLKSKVQIPEVIFLFEVQLGEPCVIWVVNFFVETCWHISCFACEKCLLIQIIERKPELAKLEALDCGKPYDEAAWDMVHDTPYTSVYFFSSLTC